MFAKLQEKLQDFGAKASLAITGDESDKQIAELVGKATSDELIAPDWTLNMTLVDMTTQTANPRWIWGQLPASTEVSCRLSAKQSPCLIVAASWRTRCSRLCGGRYRSTMRKLRFSLLRCGAMDFCPGSFLG